MQSSRHILYALGDAQNTTKLAENHLPPILNLRHRLSKNIYLLKVDIAKLLPQFRYFPPILAQQEILILNLQVSRR